MTGQTKLLGRVQYDELEQKTIACLYKAAKRAYEVTFIAGIEEDEYLHARDSAKKLKASIKVLIDEEFEENTQDFKRLSAKMQTEIGKIEFHIEKLDELVATVETIAKILAIVDEIVKIAAGLAASAA